MKVSLQNKVVVTNSHINVQTVLVLNQIFYAQPNNHVHQIILDVGITNVIQKYLCALNYKETMLSVNQTLHINVQTDLVQVNQPIVQLKSSVQQIDQLNVTTVLANNLTINVK